MALTVDDPSDGEPFGEAVYLSSVRINDVEAGLVVSAGYGHRVGKSIAYAVVDEDAMADGGTIAVTVLGRDRKATTVEGGVLYDAENARLRG